MKAPKWLSIVWKGALVYINAKGKIRAERKHKLAKKMYGGNK